MSRSWQCSKLIILFKSLSETLILLSFRMCEWAKTKLERVKKEKEKKEEKVKKRRRRSEFQFLLEGLYEEMVREAKNDAGTFSMR